MELERRTDMWAIAPPDRLGFLFGLSADDRRQLINSFEQSLGMAYPICNVPDNEFREAILEVLSALVLFEMTFRARWNCEFSPYVLNDYSVLTLLECLGIKQRLSQHLAMQSLATAVCLGLIYRFDAALKYGYRHGEKQLRASGWASELVILDRAPDELHALTDNNLYGELVKLLLQEEHSKGWEAQVREINAGVNVGVLR